MAELFGETPTPEPTTTSEMKSYFERREPKVLVSLAYRLSQLKLEQQMRMDPSSTKVETVSTDEQTKDEPIHSIQQTEEKEEEEKKKGEETKAIKTTKGTDINEQATKRRFPVRYAFKKSDFIIGDLLPEMSPL